MFSPDLPRPLVLLLFSLAVLAGCAAQPPEQTAGDHTAEVVMYATVEEWLNLQQEVSEMDTAGVASRLATVDKTGSTGQLYYYGVLNQQLKTYGAWTVARDTFRKLQENQALRKEQRQLAGILRQYNQNRINGYTRQRALLNERAQLRQDLSRAEDEKRQLAQKIQALTELEAAISTRREE
jgi:hypothetical protein